MMANAPSRATDWAQRAVSRAPRVELPWLPRRLRAIDELQALGYPAEAYALVRETLEQAASALKEGELATAIRALLQTPADLAPPLDAAAFDARHAAWLDVARALCERVRRAHAPRKPPRALLIAASGAIVLAAIGVFAFYATRLTATASASYHSSFPASHAVDGLDTTEWLLPDKTTGHLDVALPRRRAVHAVSITNAHNRAYLDRGTKKAKIEVYDDHRVVDALAIEFESVEKTHSPRRYALRGREGTRVRITITEGFGLGGGIAEVAIE